MKKSKRSYEPHLSIREISIAPGEEWQPRSPGWSLLQVATGAGYWMQPQLNLEVASGLVLVVNPGLEGTFRASKLGAMGVKFFPVEPERLMGLLTLAEQQCFVVAASQKRTTPRVHAPDSVVAIRMQALCASQPQDGARFRLQLIQIFLDAFGNELSEAAVEPVAMMDAKDRLRDLLRKTPASELFRLTFTDLCDMTRCTPRHMSRIFQEVVGVSFREKVTEMRLMRARELLATTDSKIVDVALESGYQSLSLFNLMFSRRFGMSPGRWRQAVATVKATPPRSRRREFALAGAGR